MLVTVALAIGTVSCEYDPLFGVPPGPPMPYALTVAKFRGNRLGAVSYTLDDGYQEQYDTALPMFETYGIPATCSVIVGVTRDRRTDPPSPLSADKMTWDELLDAQARGFEIGNHSMTHTDLTTIVDEQRLRREIIESADIIAQKLGQPPLVFVFPYGRWSPQLEAMALTKHAAVRQGNIVSYGTGATVATLQQANALIETAIRLKRWAVPVIHGIAAHYQPLDPVMLRQHLQYVRSRKSELWIDTYGSIARYTAERQATTHTIIRTAPQYIGFTLSCALNTLVYSVPLTFVVETGAADIVNAKALDLGTGALLPAQVEQSRILVDVAPSSAKSVVVKWARAKPRPRQDESAP